MSASGSSGSAPEDGAETLDELTAYVIDGHDFRIRPAPLERPWMERTDQRFAYRCLPLNIANAHGWEILNTAGFAAIWDGRDALDAIRIIPDPGRTPMAVSHFGQGVLTFHVPCLFRTSAGSDLFVTGPINRPKDSISALSGVVETDWSPFTFTMNWMFTRPYQPVRFEIDEPFCHVFPMRRGELEGVTPTLRKLSDNPALEREHRAWSESRSNFNADLTKPGSPAARQGWQKSYFRGTTPEGRTGPEDHRSKLRLKPFGDEDEG